MRATVFSLLFITVALSNAQTVISLNGTTYSEVTMPRREVEEVDDGIIVTYYFDNAIAQQDVLYPGYVLWKSFCSREPVYAFYGNDRRKADA